MFTKKIILSVGLLFMVQMWSGVAAANACESTSSNNWMSPATWTNCGSTIPQSLDTVLIKDSHIVDLDVDTAELGGLTIEIGGGLDVRQRFVNPQLGYSINLHSTATQKIDLSNALMNLSAHLTINAKGQDIWLGGVMGPFDIHLNSDTETRLMGKIGEVGNLNSPTAFITDATGTTVFDIPDGSRTESNFIVYGNRIFIDDVLLVKTASFFGGLGPITFFGTINTDPSASIPSLYFNQLGSSLLQFNQNVGEVKKLRRIRVFNSNNATIELNLSKMVAIEYISLSNVLLNSPTLTPTVVLESFTTNASKGISLGGFLRTATGANPNVLLINTMGGNVGIASVGDNNQPLSNLIINTPSLIELRGTSVTTTLSQDYTGDVLLSKDLVLNSPEVTFQNNIDTAGFDLTLNTTDISGATKIAGVLSGAGDLIKNGVGYLDFYSINTITGNIVLNEGQLNNQVASDAIFPNMTQLSLAAGTTATLGHSSTGDYVLGNNQSVLGNGLFVGNLITNSGAIVTPGFSPGTLSLNEINMNTGSILSIEINGTVVNTSYDQLLLDQGGSLGGATLDLSLGFNPMIGDTFEIISSNSPITGNFFELTEGVPFISGNTIFSISYVAGGGNDVVLTSLGSSNIHVDASAAPGGDGRSWALAFNNLQDALDASLLINEIWVAAGTYYPDEGGGQTPDARLASFTLIDGVSIYGGFDGTETQRDQRDPEVNVTVLSGDLNQDDINSDGNNILEIRSDIRGLNSYHIVNGVDVYPSTVFSGFTVTAGQADGVGSDEKHGAGMYCLLGFNGPSISMSTFIGHYAEYDGAATYGCSQNVTDSDFINNFSRNGGAISVRGGYYESVLFQGNTANGNGGAISKSASPLIIVNSKFIANQALFGDGGAIISVNGVTLENVLFSGNKANNFGGAIHQTNSSSQLTNVTMTGNHAVNSGGAIYIFNATLNLRNSIIWNNHDSTADTTATSSINVALTTYTQTNSLVQNFPTGGVGNLDVDPMFITNIDPSDAPTLLGNAHLNIGSPAINQGDNSFVNPLITDLDGNTRILDTTVDMGTYEFSSNAVSVNVTGLGVGSLVLQNNSTDDLTFNNDGTLVFSLPVAYSDEYLVTVFSQPTAPNQECVMSNASGIIEGLNVTVSVVCTTTQYTIGGTLFGLINGTLTLQNNTGNDLQLTSNGTFEFTTPLDDLSNYAVTVKTNPNVPKQTCLVTGGNSGQNDGTGQLAGNDYTDIFVTCTINQYSVGGTLSGLNNGTLTLQNNTGDDLQLSNNGAFEFTTQLDDLSGYAVTLTSNTSMPQQNCSITGGNSGQNDGTGDLSGSDYTGIFVFCTDIHLVDTDAPNGGDGYSWNTAFNNVQDALFNAVTGDSIWVAQGVYYPDVGGGQANNNRSASFNLKNGVSVYGGFNGTETQLNQRDPETNVTILSGDIGQDDGNLDGNNILEDKFGAVGSNSYQVILGTGISDNSTRFSGFTVTAGKADGSGSRQSGAGMYCGNGTNGPSIRMSTFIGNYAKSVGGATYGCSHDVRDTHFINNFTLLSGAINVRGGYYENVLFEGNFAVQKGGAISNSVGTLTIVNSKFIANSANAGGGALHSISAITLKNTLFSGNKSSNSNSDGGGLLLEAALTANLTNVTLTGNLAPLGGAISMTSLVTLNVRNSIIWNNHGFQGAPNIDVNGGTYNQTNSLVQDFGTGGTGNFDEDPLFILATDPTTAPTNLGDAHLQVISPVVNRGDNSFVTGLITDLDGNARIQHTTVDMGVYESGSDAYNIIHVDASAAAGGHGRSWAMAFNNLQDALATADSGKEIWVAQGVYYPDVGGGQANNDRFASFNLKNGVSVYGGFDGTETELIQRDHEINVTVLSGDLNQDDINSDGNNILEIRSDLRGSNSYHIIKGSNVDASTVFSGFIVTAGQANHIPQIDESKGSGMYCGNNSSGPSINNSTFIANYARDSGAATYGCSQDVRDSNFINNYSGLASDFSGSGGAISSRGGYYENVVFQGNGAHENGGALLNAGAVLTIVNSKFIANSSKVSDGGALYSTSKVVLENVLFSGNKAVGGFGSGGAIYLKGFHTSNFTNVTMTDNSTNHDGGAIYFVQADLILRNSILWSNFKAGASTTASSSIFKLGSGAYTQTNSLVQNFGITGVDNLDEDPLFITNLDTTNTIYPITFGNTRLQYASMAIDAGDNSFVTSTNDLDGQDRILNTTVDMGAYESSSHTVSVMVSGLVAGTLELQNNGADNLTFSTDGTQVFNIPVANTADYLVTVFSPPTAPSQICIVTNGNGTINGNDIADVSVNCLIAQFNVIVDVSGLANGVTLNLLNNNEALDVTNNGQFNFATALDDLSAYAVSITSLPTSPNQQCLITSGNASSNLAGSDVVVTIACTTIQYNVGVDVSGLANGVTLSLLNNSEALDVTNNGQFNFATALDDLSGYAVSITSQPTSPNQQCLITSGNVSGNLAGSDVVVTIACTTIQYNVGVDVSGLANGSTLSLLNNSEALDVTNNGQFNFSTAIDDLSGYVVSITSQPTSPNQECLITSGNESGNLAGSDILITIECTTIQYNVGVNVSGLENGNTLELENNGEALTVIANGQFNFPMALNDGSTYGVIVVSQPTTPSQICSVVSGSGFLNGSDVLITITCSTDQYFVGGITTGLANGNSATLMLESENLEVNANGTFVFLNPLTDESNYSISVNTQPTMPNQTCDLVNSSGIIMGNDVIDIELNCITNQYLIGGTVTGLHSNNILVLQNNDGDDLIITSSEDFDFVTRIDDLEGYNVTILEQPNTPQQPCVINNNTGTVSGDHVINVLISCEFGDDLIFKQGFE